MLEEYDRKKRDEIYYVNAGEMIDWMHQDLIDGTINGAQYEKILEKYVYSIVDEL